ncbi:unnamed protein product [Anisakis simplex]|uniref:Uncharacterized protein n=1 Tax=Anisakis simplex TaxID=6269 RepID=A0A3P6NZP7_ANISI|nr:unnamed protein product [Anisakis simplex]
MKGYLRNGFAFKDASKAIDIEVDDLPRLSLLMSEESYREWRVKWQKAIDQIDRILQLPFDEFWSSLIYSPKPMNYVDSFLDVFPRRWEIDEMKLYVNTDAMVCTLSMSLFERVILVLLRAVTNNENSLCLSDEFYLRVIYDYKIFTIERLFNLINVYCKSNAQSISIILQRTIGVQNKFMHDANNFVDICAKVMFAFVMLIVSSNFILSFWCVCECVM